MSKYGWERGEVKMSTKEYGAFRRSMIAFVNTVQAKNFVKAQEAFAKLKLAAKGKRNFDFQTAFADMMTMSGYSVEGDALFNALFPHEKTETGSWQRVRKPKAPKKNMFPMLKQSATSIDVGGEAGIGFDNKTRRIHWHVSENNHSVDRAHSHPVGKEFFYRLGRVVWTRGTGGEFTGNDEYNQESHGAGERANYVTSRYGVAEKQFKQSLGIAYRRGF